MRALLTAKRPTHKTGDITGLMRTYSPALLLPLLRSKLQGDLLALLFLHPDDAYSLTEAARLTGVSQQTLQTEASRLVDGGILIDKRVGRTRLIQANRDTPLFAPLTDLMQVTYGPLPVLRDAFQDVPDIEQVMIYGSWAARYQGRPGPIPNDVDVLVIGTVDLDMLDDIAERTRKTLHREVNIRRITPQNYDRAIAQDPFLQHVAASPLVYIKESAHR